MFTLSTLISLLVVIVIVGFLLYLFNVLVPLPAPWKTVVNALVGLFVFLYILSFFGVWNGFVVHR